MNDVINICRMKTIYTMIIAILSLSLSLLLLSSSRGTYRENPLSYRKM